MALDTVEVPDGKATFGGLLDQWQLLQIEKAVGATADRERTSKQFGRQRVLVKRGVCGAETGERRDQSAG
jgi:hypothetical protein